MTSSDHKMDQFLVRLGKLITPYQRRFDTVLSELSDSLEFGVVEVLKKASEYALSSGGKRFRPSIVWMMGEAVGLVPQSALDNPAFAVEYFHTASLIADDLPCMDNDDFRRGIPTTHKAFNEATAVLASFSLIALGFQAIARTPLPPSTEPQKQNASIHQKAVLEASYTMGANGLLGGQIIDLTPPDSSLETIEKIMDMKTGALFSLCFTLGWLFGGGAIEKLSLVHELARDFGRAFQIVDDLDDLEQDRAAQKMINYALQFGVEEAVNAIDQYVQSAIIKMKELGLYQGKRDDEKPLVILTQILSDKAHKLQQNL